jgi:hypothetical protein
VNAVRRPGRRRPRGAGPRARAGRTRCRAGTVVGVTLLVVASLLLRTTALHARYWIDEGLSVGIAQHPLEDIPGSCTRTARRRCTTCCSRRGSGSRASARRTRTSSPSPSRCVRAGRLSGGARPVRDRGGVVGDRSGATSPFLTFYAQETRMYTLVALLSLIARRPARWPSPSAGAHGRPCTPRRSSCLIYTHIWGLLPRRGRRAGARRPGLVGARPGAARARARRRADRTARSRCCTCRGCRRCSRRRGARARPGPSGPRSTRRSTVSAPCWAARRRPTRCCACAVAGAGTAARPRPSGRRAPTGRWVPARAPARWPTWPRRRSPASRSPGWPRRPRPPGPLATCRSSSARCCS